MSYSKSPECYWAEEVAETDVAVDLMESKVGVAAEPDDLLVAENADRLEDTDAVVVDTSVAAVAVVVVVVVEEVEVLESWALQCYYL